jgi:hypothetical protein
MRHRGLGGIEGPGALVPTKWAPEGMIRWICPRDGVFKRPDLGRDSVQPRGWPDLGRDEVGWWGRPPHAGIVRRICPRDGVFRRPDLGRDSVQPRRRPDLGRDNVKLTIGRRWATEVNDRANGAGQNDPRE